jgi:hypothetical protein
MRTSNTRSFSVELNRARGVLDTIMSVTFLPFREAFLPSLSLMMHTHTRTHHRGEGEGLFLLVLLRQVRLHTTLDVIVFHYKKWKTTQKKRR